MFKTSRMSAGIPGILVLLLMGCPNPGKIGREDDGKPRVRLLARTYAPAAGIGKGVMEYLAKLKKEQKRRAHLLLQLHGPLKEDTRGLLLKQGKTRLLDPIPDNAWFATLPPDPELLGVLLKNGVRAVQIIRPGDKIGPWLAKGIPEHARRPKGKGEFVILFFGDVTPAEQRAVLQAQGIPIRTQVGPVNGWRVLLDPTKLDATAALDEVKWIAEVPPPPTEDNDSARSVTGVNAVVVHPPTLYNLTGAGVILAQWEPLHASMAHGDFGGRVTLADPPFLPWERSCVHDESVTVNARFDNGEGVYRDNDDSLTVTVGDWRVTPVGALGGNQAVVAGDADLATGLIFFVMNNAVGPVQGEEFADTVVGNITYDVGEGIYRDNDLSSTATVGDQRLTAVAGFAAGTVLALGDADVGQNIRAFLRNPHSHPTHVAGTAVGSGAQSLAQGGTANQWQGIAPGATMRSYAGNPTNVGGTPVPADEYTDAAANGVTISTNSWGTSHMHQVVPPATGYDFGSQYYDAVISGRRSDGTASGIASVSIFASAGNKARPERHAENVAVNGAYDNGETVYRDRDDDGLVSATDTRLSGPILAVGTGLVNFALNEMHDDTVSLNGTGWQTYDNGEGVYLDADTTRTVTVGDTRITAAGGFGAGTVVAGGDGDIGTNLRRFLFWEGVRVPNCAKNTVVVANISSDTSAISPSSSRGPTLDGRLKPDVAGPGTENGSDFAVTSTFPGNQYTTMSGTSMSTPAVSGVGALFTEWYTLTCGGATPPPAALRALLIHTAQDLLPVPTLAPAFTGPDFTFGYGAVKANVAVNTLPHHVQGTAAAVGNTDYTITIGEMNPLKVTLAWDDPPWTANAAASPVTGMLQNDLDLLLIAPDGTQYTPWNLTPATPGAVATRTSTASGTPVPAANRDRLNNVEQVVVDAAMAGTWTIRVTASTLNLPPQPFTVVCDQLPVELGPGATAPASDVWIKDNPGDTGAVPSSGSMWLGPDLWNRLVDDDLTIHENPEFGQENYLYANVRNAGAALVRAVSFDVWAGSASAGLVWPDAFSYVGRFSVPNLGAGEVRQIGPLAWDPPSPVPSSHFCLYMRVQSPQDPITFAESASVWTNASNSNNIAYRNITVVDLLSSKSVTFLVRNVEREPRTVDLVIRTPKEFMEEGKVFVRLSPGLEKRWPADRRKDVKIRPAKELQVVKGGNDEKDEPGQENEPEEEPFSVPYQLLEPEVRFPGIRLGGREALPVTLTFQSPSKKRAAYEVEIIQEVNERVVGGIRLVVRTKWKQ